MKKSYFAKEKLPEGYVLSECIDLAKNKRQMTFVTVLSLVLLVVVLLAGFILRPGLAVFSDNSELLGLVGFLALLGYVVYIVLHEAVHGLLMWYFSKKKPHFGASLQYAYAGSDAYFRKVPYLVIALAPLVVWGMVFLWLALIAPGIWFWLIWFFQAGNVSGAAGDLYVFARICAMESAVLVQDDGVRMRIYAPGTDE